MSVAVTGLTKYYGEQVAVNQVSFEARRGEILGFLGPNGAGKSTTMKMICGYLPPSEGTATICGFDVTTASMKARRCVGYLPENNPLYTEMFVSEFLLFTAKLSGVTQRKQRVKEMISRVGLQTEQHKKIGALSKGFRQRVGLAQALLHDPEVLILDEPTSGLDPNQLSDVRRMIKELSKEKTVILSTHIMQEVEAICDRVVIISKGSVVADASVAELQNRSRAAAIIRVTFKNAVSVEELKKVKGISRVHLSGTNSFTVESSFNNEEDIFQFAVQQQNIITRLEHQKAGLEEIFKELTAGDASTSPTGPATKSSGA